jgi:hypothetical protein
VVKALLEASRLRSGTPHSVGLLWTSDRPVAETPDKTQHSQETDIHVPGGIRTRNSSKRAAADLSASYIDIYGFVTKFYA